MGMSECSKLCRSEDDRFTTMGRADHKWAFKHGLKFCANCVRFVKGKPLMCPCCNRQLRTSIRNHTWRDDRRRVPDNFYPVDTNKYKARDMGGKT